MEKYDFLTINFAGSLGILFLIVFLLYNSQIEAYIRQKFFLLIFLEILEMAAFSAELVTDTFSHFTEWRVLFSVVGYIVRPLLIYVILTISLRTDLTGRHKRLLAIPAIINSVIVSTAFFSDISFGYTNENIFYRGPLAYSSHFVIVFYLAALIVNSVREAPKRKQFEQVIIYLMAGVISMSMLIETAFPVRNIGRTAVVMCTVFYYMFFQSSEYNRKMSRDHSQIEGLYSKIKLDQMTGLLNKKSFEAYCAESLALDHSVSTAFIFIDLDHFKQVNDQLGHTTGDRAIMDAAEKLKGLFRSKDYVSRFGGDEFCVCMREIPYCEVGKRLQNICSILKHEYRNNDNTVQIEVTCSIGAVYCSGCEAADYRTLVEKADEALYQAKALGRDRYVIHRI